ncbi:MAG: histidine phosphatase family protein [Odoribacter sp.]|nr:histidine phosphatase family protein [Odoribacter sp.]
MRKKILIALIAVSSLAVNAANPMATNYTMSQCEGSLTPYPTEINPAVYPDSLTPVYINHVGRHGARYPASSANCLKMRQALLKADSLGTITPAGRQLMRLNDLVIARSENQWGALDSIGMAEQRAIATRLFYNFGQIFKNGCKVNALSSYSPRSMMSMYSFLHQLDRMDNRINFNASTGRVNNATMRPFDIDQDYLQFRKDNEWKPAYDEYFNTACPTTAIRKVLGERYPFVSEDEARDLAITEYYVVAGCSCMGIDPEASRFFTKEEYNALWSCFNLRQYLQRTASTISSVPADIASQLLQDIISTTDAYIDGTGGVVANFRFGHAETLMPLLSLMRLKGCYYMTNYFDTVGQHWCDFDVVPMAANLQIILFKAERSGHYYVRVDVNEVPVPLQPGSSSLYTLWGDARDYLTRCLPLYAQ